MDWRRANAMLCSMFRRSDHIFKRINANFPICLSIANISYGFVMSNVLSADSENSYISDGTFHIERVKQIAIAHSPSDLLWPQPDQIDPFMFSSVGNKIRIFVDDLHLFYAKLKSIFCPITVAFAHDYNQCARRLQTHFIRIRNFSVWLSHVCAARIICRVIIGVGQFLLKKIVYCCCCV